MWEAAKWKAQRTACRDRAFRSSGHGDQGEGRQTPRRHLLFENIDEPRAARQRVAYLVISGFQNQLCRRPLDPAEPLRHLVPRHSVWRADSVDLVICKGPTVTSHLVVALYCRDDAIVRVDERSNKLLIFHRLEHGWDK